MARDTKRASCNLAGSCVFWGGGDGSFDSASCSNSTVREDHDPGAMATRWAWAAMRPHRAPRDPLPGRRSGPMASEASRSEACGVARLEDE